MSKLAKLNLEVDKKALKKLDRLPHEAIEQLSGKSNARPSLWPAVSLLLVIGLLAWLLIQKTQNEAQPKQSQPAQPGQDDSHQQMGATESEVQPVTVPHTGEPVEAKAEGEKTEIIIDPQSELTPG